jgi:hypothetical protein
VIAWARQVIDKYMPGVSARIFLGIIVKDGFALGIEEVLVVMMIGCRVLLWKDKV